MKVTFEFDLKTAVRWLLAGLLTWAALSKIANLQEFQGVATWLHTPPDTALPPRDELIIKVLVSLRLPGVDLHEVLQVHRRHFVEAMQHCTQIKARAADDDLELALVADAELFRLDAVVRWLDAADARLKRRPVLQPDKSSAPTPRPARKATVWG